ncbi:NUDIX domain-containing protein [bacterium]|nr:NUDIX domain-containing protein [bacterium]
MSQKNRKKLPHLNVSAGIIRKGEKILIAQRATADVFGNLWEFPGGKQKEGETLKERLHREMVEESGVEMVDRQRAQESRRAHSWN